jgi:DNA-binding MarR family transcriptional regulator
MNKTTLVFDQQLIGQTEKTMNAILERLLAGRGLREPEWVTLVLSAAGDGSPQRDELTLRVAGALKVDDATAANHVGALGTKGLLHTATGDGSAVTPTEAGRQLIDSVRRQTGAVTQRLWGDLPDADLKVAGGVLQTVLERAEAELEASR